MAQRVRYFFSIFSIPDPNGTATITYFVMSFTIPMAQRQLHSLIWQTIFYNLNGTTCPGKIFDGFASVFQFHVGGWGSSRLLADNLLSHVAEKIRAMHASDFRPIANIRTLYKVFAYFIFGASNIHLTSINPKNNMDSAQNIGLKTTCLQSISFLQQSDSARNTRLDGQFGSFKSIWPCALANSLECIACSRYVGSHDMGAVETVWGPIRRSAWQVGI